ncbi:molybdopterin-dependent oxidoreductase [Pseudonocardia nematodicida]|uniref:Molybdopterin-dependent oxidoreductase n=1 Tax=Pseudonocardia nematodicida TaxID=1206997 RepID=A0ABV1KJH9_9PSEU
MPEPVPGPEPLSRGRAVLTGVLGVGSALAAGDLVAGLVSPPSSPFLAVGDQFVRLTPEWLKDAAIAAFGVYDKTALLTGMGAVLGVLAVLAGLVARRRPGPGLAVIAGMGLLAAVCTQAAPTAAPADLLAPAVALVTGVAVFAGLHRALGVTDPGRVRPGGGTRGAATPGAPPARRAPADRAEPSPGLRSALRDAPVRRRRALTLAGGVALGSLAAGAAGRLLASRAGAQTVIALPAVAIDRVPPPPAGVDLPGAPSWLTPVGDFYRIDTALQVPRIDPASWTLRIHGMVERELTLTFAELEARPLVERPITMVCVSNPVGGDLISTARFLGVRLADLLAEAGVRTGAEQLLSTSVDGFTTSTPVDVATDGRDALLAIGMNGAALPVEHGFPVRMVVPGLYGYVSGCKWITDIELTTWDAAPAYWTERGWAPRGPVKTQSRIDTPAAGASVPAGRVAVAGTAWALHVGITRVEVAVDDGPWRPAELGADGGADTWRMWRTTVDLAAGARTLRVRATDRTGTVQTEQEQPVVPDGATGWSAVPVTVV